MDDSISRQAAIKELESGKDKKAKGEIGGFYNQIIENDIEKLKKLPSAQPELIEQGAYVRGFEQGRTQGMIDAQGELMSRLINNTIKAEWTNADALDLQSTCNQLATNTISRQAAIDTLADYIHNVDKVIGTGHLSADDCKDAATSVLEDLPSAQPEIIRCKDCEYWREYKYVNGKPKFLPRCGFHQIYTREDDFCSKAERREE